MPGMGELLVILVIVLLIFGAGKLPQIGDALGRSIRNFKRAASTGDQEAETNRQQIEVSRRSELEVSAKRELTAGRAEVEDAEVVAAKSDKKKS